MTRRILGAAIVLIAGCGVLAAQDLESTLSLLKGAEAQKNVDEIKKLAVDCITQGRKAAADAKGDKDAAEFATSVSEYGEYALFNAATTAPAASKVDLYTTLEQNSPKSKYLGPGYRTYFAALRETGQSAKIADIADKAIANFPDNADLLSVAMEDAAAKKQSDKMLTYATRLIAAVPKTTKPEGVSDSDWEKWKSANLGPAYYSAGAAQVLKQQWMPADRSLRSSLPYIKGNEAMYGQALLLLGNANYQIGVALSSRAKIMEGANFCTQASKVPGFSNAAEAQRQAALMTAAAAKYR